MGGIMEVQVQFLVQIIYSYGKGNKYKHPSKTYEYSNNGWNNRHDTVIGDYEIRF